MRLDLRPILRTPGASLPFQCALDLSDVEWNGERPITKPVEIRGTVRNMAGALELTAQLIRQAAQLKFQTNLGQL